VSVRPHITGDVDTLPICTLAQAERLIEGQNAERYDEAMEALGDGDQDDFRYLSPRWFLMTADCGRQFIANISGFPDGGIGYDLHYRIVI
jgi:hypothetical protein